MKKTAVIGIGNTLRQDDSIGIVLLDKLKQKKEELNEKIEFIDGGSGGMNLLHYLADFDKVFIIDAVDFGGKPGEFRFFQKDDVVSKKIKIHFSTHENDFLKIINLSEELNEMPEKLFIFGIQPKNMGIGSNLSPELSESLEKNLNQITKEIINLK
jgi:hydrogenase maturation protease